MARQDTVIIYLLCLVWEYPKIDHKGTNQVPSSIRICFQEKSNSNALKEFKHKDLRKI